MAQEYIAAVETQGEWSLVYINCEFSHSVLKRPRAGDFRVQHNFGGTITVAAAPSEVVAFGKAALAELGHPAVFARVDVIVERGPLCLRRSK
jgi:hypothetical protein